jgi:hypothetical protein
MNHLCVSTCEAIKALALKGWSGRRIARELLRHWGADAALVNADQPDTLVKANPRGAEVLKLVQQRERVLKDAWLTHVGHQRPGMGKGKPLPEAEEEAKALAAKLREVR